MGYLDNRTITVDAILTKKGRQLLSQGRQFFNITKFALADDEVDYHLWNPAHPSGSNYYGVAIEQMPVLEPSPDETQTMRYKLVSLDKSTVKIPVVSVYPTTISFTQGTEVIVTPNTSYSGTGGTGGAINLNGTFGYTAILHNSDVAYLQVADAAPSAGSTINDLEIQIADVERRIAEAEARGEEVLETFRAHLRQLRAILANLLQAANLSGAGTGMFLGDTESARSLWAVGLKFRLVAKQITTQASISTTLTIVGNETGGSATISITNNRVQLVSSATQ